MPLLKIKIVATQEQLSKWNAPLLKTGDIKEAKPTGDDFGYLIKESGIKQDFWYAVPKDFAERIDQ